MLKRRQFLQTGVATSMMLPGMARLALANTGGEARLVVVLLRGGMDGLAAVPAYAEADYARLRGQLALAPPGSSGGILKLDGLFGLHPALTGLYDMYKNKELLIAHAVATSYRQRSHFDGQKQLENGTDSPLGADNGWLNRALPLLPSGNREAVALAQNIPLILYGDASVNSWSPGVLPEADKDTIARIARMYANDSFFSEQLQSALQTRSMVDDLANDGGMTRGRGPGRQNMELLVKAAGKFLSDRDGPRIAVIESSGWDTHANQGAESGQLANQFVQLDSGVGLLREALGNVWQHTVIVVVSEFGRTVAVNGSRGTDHGTGSAAFILGGAVRGGRVLSDWPGLARSSLYEGRDLRATMDMRSLFKSLLHDHLQIASAALEQRVFPDSARAPRVNDLLA